MIHEVDNIILEYEVNVLKYNLFISKTDYITESMDSNISNIREKAYEIYTEAKESLWKKFKDWVKRIWNAILGKANDTKETDRNKDDEIEIKSDPSAVGKFVNSLKQGLKDLSNKKDVGKVTIAGIALSTGIAALVVALKKKFGIERATKMTVAKAIVKSEDLKKQAADMVEYISQLESADDAESDTGKEKIQVAKEALQAINEAQNDIEKAIKTLSDEHKSGKVTRESLNKAEKILKNLESVDINDYTKFRKSAFDLANELKRVANLPQDKVEEAEQRAKAKAATFTKTTKTQKQINSELKRIKNEIIKESWKIVRHALNEDEMKFIESTMAISMLSFYVSFISQPESVKNAKGEEENITATESVSTDISFENIFDLIDRL